MLVLSFLYVLGGAVSVPFSSVRAAGWSVESPPKGWSVQGLAPQDHPLEFVIAVRMHNIDLLERELMAVSDPASPRYGRHLTRTEVNRLTAPLEEHLDVILKFLDTGGIRNVSVAANGAFISFAASVRQASALLNAQYHMLKDAKGRNIVRTSSFELPSSVHAVIDVFEPTVWLPTATVQAPQITIGNTAPSFNTTPASLRSLYGVGDTEGKKGTGNIQATANFLGQYYSPSDLQTFFNELYPKGKGRTVAQQYGPNNASEPGTEAQLDIQYLMSLGGGVETWFWSTEEKVLESVVPFLQWMLDVAATDTVPLLFSISYADYEDATPLSYVERASQEFMKAGVRGITILSGSGDGGVEGVQAHNNSGGRPQCPCPGGKFVATFPCTSPYETCVGATTLEATEEVAAFFSAGGFSNYFGTAAFQRDAVASWKVRATESRLLPRASLFNATGRGFPDVAALGRGFQVVDRGQTISVGGASASTPTFAGIVSLLNDDRLQAGKPPLGFLNPLLYANPGAFHDITSGNNPGCNEDGFYAQKGWDPVTGLGTPDFAKLRAVVAALPPHEAIEV